MVTWVVEVFNVILMVKNSINIGINLNNTASFICHVIDLSRHILDFSREN